MFNIMNSELRTQNCLFDICSTFIFTNVNVNVDKNKRYEQMPGDCC